MGIRAVQAGALTSAIDHSCPPTILRCTILPGRPGSDDWLKRLASPPLRWRIATRDTLVLGVKNRTELAECVAAADTGPFPSELMARVDEVVPPGART